MLRLFSVAVTGSLASGKSTVCRFFEQWGAYVVDADRLLHQVFSAETPVGKKIYSLFGESVLRGSVIDRARVAEMAFSSQELIEKLEDICHPYVNQAIIDEYNIVSQGSYAFFAAEVPLLFESRYPIVDWFDATIVVIADPEIARKRSFEKGLDTEQYSKREQRLLPLEKKTAKATYVVTNNGSLEELGKQAKSLFEELKHRNISQQS